jgi:hypothetical protein
MPSAIRTAPPPPSHFSPQATLRQWGPHVEPSVHRRRLVGTQPKWRMRDPPHDKPSGRRKSNHDPRGLLAWVPRSHAHGRSLLRPFLASADIFKNTTEEWCSGAAQHTVSDKPAQLGPAPSSSREHRPTSLSLMLRRVRRVARRGTNSAVRRP